MATYNNQSDLININYITYPPLPGSGLPLRIAVWSGKRKEQSPVPSARQAKNDDSRLLQGTVLESGGKPRTGAVVGALVVQMVLVTVLVVAPLFHTEELPKRETLTMLYAPSPAAASGVTFQAPRSTYTPSSISIPNPIRASQEMPPPPVETTDGVVGGIPGGMVGGVTGGLLSEVASTRSVPVLEKTPEPTNKRMRIASQVAEANLIHDVAPQYPPEAGRERIEGTVVLLAVIGKDGAVREVRVKSGLPLLAQAAIDAVKQWRYKPYLMNGEPIEVDSQITINFNLSRG